MLRIALVVALSVVVTSCSRGPVMTTEVVAVPAQKPVATPADSMWRSCWCRIWWSRG